MSKTKEYINEKLLEKIDNLSKDNKNLLAHIDALKYELNKLQNRVPDYKTSWRIGEHEISPIMYMSNWV